MNNWHPVLQAVREAGKAIVDLHQTSFYVTKKAHNELVTEADLLVNDILKHSLGGLLNDDAWLSEESIVEDNCLTASYVWIVDPIDGTREYALKIPEYSISVALIKHHTPIFSVVYNPSRDELFYAIQNQGAYLNDERIYCQIKKDNQQNLTILASRNEYEKGLWKKFYSCLNIKPVGSIAYKMALVAAGVADGTFSLGPKNIWDVAAGALLIIEANGIVTDKYQQNLTFNTKEVKVNGIIASSRFANQKIISLINR